MKFRKIISGVFAVAVMAMALLPATVTHAAPIDVFDRSCQGSSSEICSERDESLFGSGSVWNRVINTFIFIIGIVSVFMVLLGGFKYITANGDSSSLTSAKNTILYAIVGVVVAISAYAIINFVVTNLV